MKKSIVFMAVLAVFAACKKKNYLDRTDGSLKTETTSTAKPSNEQLKTVSACNISIPSYITAANEELTLITIPADASSAFFNLNWKTACYSISANISFGIDLTTSEISITSFSDSEGRNLSHVNIINQYSFQTPYLSSI